MVYISTARCQQVEPQGPKRRKGGRVLLIPGRERRAGRIERLVVRRRRAVASRRVQVASSCQCVFFSDDFQVDFFQSRVPVK